MYFTPLIPSAEIIALLNYVNRKYSRYGNFMGRIQTRGRIRVLKAVEPDPITPYVRGREFRKCGFNRSISF